MAGNKAEAIALGAREDMMAVRRRLAGVLIIGMMVLSGMPHGARAAEPPRVRLAVGGANCFCYLPTVLAQALDLFRKNGVDAELIALKGGSQALAALLGGSADLVSGFYDHTVNLAAKGKEIQSVVIFDRLPGLVLAVSPKHGDRIKSVGDLLGKPVGVTAPGSSTDFFLKYLLRKAGYDADKVSVVGIGPDQTAFAALEQGQVVAGVVVDPVMTRLSSKYPDIRVLVDTRSETDTRKLFGGDYPAGSIYAQSSWIKTHGAETQAVVDALVETLQWIGRHTPEEIMAKMPQDYVGEDQALYLAALKNALPMYSKTGLMDPKGAVAVLAVFAQSNPEIANANIDLLATYSNEFATKADAKFGIAAQ